MNESEEIVRLYRSAIADGQRMLMATVVDVVGSSYRRPGAHFLIAEDRRTAGSISAGCLEKDVLERCDQLFAHDKTSLLRYDNMSNDELYALNFGCDGIIQVLVEPVRCEGMNVARATELAKFESENVIIGTVTDGAQSDLVGAKLVAVGREVVECNLPCDVSHAIQNTFEEVVSRGRNRISEHAIDDGTHFKLFWEVVKPPIEMIVCGAGDDVIPLVQVAGMLGVSSKIIDGRQVLLDIHKEHAEVHNTRNTSLISLVQAPERTAIVIMSHHFEMDKTFLRDALKTDCAFLGVMGPARRTEKMLAEIDAQHERSRLRFPIGLDLGAETKEEIALSVCSEILAFLRDADGGSLSKRDGPIHRRVSKTNETVSSFDDSMTVRELICPLTTGGANA